MKRIFVIAIIMVAVAIQAIAADYNSLWKKVNDAREKDQPRTVCTLLGTISNAAKAERKYGDMLAAQILTARCMTEISPDSLRQNVAKLEQQAAASADGTVLSAVYSAVLAKIYANNGSLYGDSTDIRVQRLWDKALSHPDILAATPASDYSRLVITGSDDRLWNSDLLSLIGHEAGRYSMLINYYDSIGNRRAAIVEQYLHAVNDLTPTRRCAYLTTLLSQYQAEGQYTDGTLALFYEALAQNTDLTDASRYAMLSDAIARYPDSPYTNTLRNRIAELTNRQFTVNTQDGLVITDIRNVKHLKVEFLRLSADGSKDLSTDDKGIREVLRMAAGTPSSVVERNYDKAIWQLHDDTLAMPELPRGVYLIRATGDDITHYGLYHNTSLTLLALPLSKNDVRLVVASSETGKPVAGATIELTREDYRTGKVLAKRTLTTDSRGECMFNTKQFTGGIGRVFVHTADDRAFRKTSFSQSFYLYASRQHRDIITLFTDRSIYRPGQTLRGGIVVHNSEHEDSIHTVRDKRVTIAVRNSENKTIHTDTIVTDRMGNAGFVYQLPTECRNGLFTVIASAENSNSGYASVSVESFRRPAFELTVVNADTLRNHVYAEKDTATVIINAATITQLPVRGATVTYTVSRHREWFCWWYGRGASRRINTDTETDCGTVTTDADGNVAIPVAVMLPEDDYSRYAFTVHAIVTDTSGETHEVSTVVHAQRPPLTSEPSRTPLEQQIPDFSVSSNTFPHGDSVTLTVANGPADGQLYYTLIAGNNVIESSSLPLHRKYTRTFKYEKRYGEGLTLSYVWVSEGKVHAYSTTIIKPQPELSLHPVWTSFRDRTVPGSKEHWTLSLPAGDDYALTATIYDRSLDLLRHLSWGIDVVQNSYNIGCQWYPYMTHNYSFFASRKMSYLTEHPLSYASFDMSLMPYEIFLYKNFGRPVMRAASGAKMMMKTMSANVMMEASAAPMTTDGMEAKEEKRESPDTNDSAPKVSYRTDLAETAYFTPSLVSSADGKLHLEFTLPETMTTWRVQGFVHDRRMRHAFIDTTCVVRKDIIVQPNVPRYLREGDRPVFATNVSNTTTQPLTATVTMQLLTDDGVSVIWTSTSSVTIPAGETTSVAMPMNERISASAILRITAVTTSGTSDGEQHYIPVLPATETITRTLAFTDDSNCFATVDEAERYYARAIDSLFVEGSTERQVSIEITDNLVGQVMSSLSEAVHPASDNALDLASALYANLLAKYIKEESHLTDSVGQSASIDSITHKLHKLQNADGSWSWWEGMPSSIYVSSNVVRLFSRLAYKGCITPEAMAMLERTLPYLTKEVQEELDRIKKENEKRKTGKTKVKIWNSYLESYLYCMSLLHRSNSTFSQCLSYVEKHYTPYSIQSKAELAVIFALNGKNKLAQQQLQSIEEYTVVKDGKRYYDSPRAPYSWRNYRIPTVVAAMEAMSIIGGKEKAIREMQLWLLSEKRTQQWDNSVNTADAIHAFTMTKTMTKTMTETKTEAMTNNLKWVGIFVTQRLPLRDIPASSSGFTVSTTMPTDSKVSEGRVVIESDYDCDFVTVRVPRPACMELTSALSGFRWIPGEQNSMSAACYEDIHDDYTDYHFLQLSKGTHVLPVRYFIDRQGTYSSSVTTVKCTYAPEYSANDTNHTVSITAKAK